MTTRTRHLFPLAVAALLSWGALAFGSEYSWAYAPLLVFALVVAALGLLGSRGVRFPAPAIGVALAAIVAGVLLQLAPLPQRVIRAVSPASVAEDYALLYAKATMQPVEASPPSAGEAFRPVSIAPSRTALGLTFLVVLIVLFVWGTRGISAIGPLGIARSVLFLGLVVALLELAQRASGSAVIYGFWYPPQLKGYHSAPFVNRNHTAGWLLMALALSVGSLAGVLANGLREAKPDWRHRVLWLSSRHGSEALLTGFAVAAMAISIVATASRSGSVCLALVILMFGWWVARRQLSRSRKAFAFGYLVVVALAALSFGGMEILAGRLHQTSWSDLDGRVHLWKDTARIIQDFPWTGTGWNTYGIAMLRYQTLQDGSQYIEAHNDYVQVASEGGLLVTIPIAITLLLFIREVRRRFQEGDDHARTYWLRVGAVTGLCAIAAQATLDFTLQMPGAAVLFVVLAAIAIHRPSPVHGSDVHHSH